MKTLNLIVVIVLAGVVAMNCPAYCSDFKLADILQSHLGGEVSSGEMEIEIGEYLVDTKEEKIHAVVTVLKDFVKSVEQPTIVGWISSLSLGGGSDVIDPFQADLEDKKNPSDIIDPLDFVSATVPESGTLVLLGFGLLGISGLARRKSSIART